MTEPLDSIHAAIGHELLSPLQKAASQAADVAYKHACDSHMDFKSGLRFVMRAIAEAVSKT